MVPKSRRDAKIDNDDRDVAGGQGRCVRPRSVESLWGKSCLIPLEDVVVGCWKDGRSGEVFGVFYAGDIGNSDPFTLLLVNHTASIFHSQLRMVQSGEIGRAHV